MDIESKAVSAINDCIANTSKLKSYITQNDKTPIQDGCINVYGKDGYKNEDLIFAVPVQVKGKESNTFERHISYSIDISSLNFFLNKGGALFFVVVINSETNKTKIYYTDLLPYKIKMLFKNLRKSQKTKSITLKRFPDNENELLDLFLNFIENSKKQAAVAMTGILSLEDLKNKGEKICRIESSYIASDIDSKNPDENLLGKKVFQYAVTSTNIYYPIAEIEITGVKIEFKNNVVCGDIEYESFKIVKEKYGNCIIFGDNIYIKEIKKNEVKMSFSPKGNLSERIKALRFISNLINGNDLYINEEKAIQSCDVFSNFDKNKLDHHIKLLTDFKKALSLAGIKENKINNEILINNDFLSFFIGVFVYGKTVPFKTDLHREKGSGLADFKFLKCMIFAEAVNEDIYKVFNFFTYDYPYTITGRDGEKYSTSKFVTLSASQFEEAFNIPYESMLDDLKRCSFSIYHYTHTILMLLEMIKAFDKTKDDILYKTMLEIAEWLNSLDVSGYDKYSSLINYLQCKKRKSKLNDNDKYEIMSILKDDLIDDYKLACFILLDMKEKAKETFEHLDKETKENFIKYPIYTLFKEIA